jgi:hypothetical protein
VSWQRFSIANGVELHVRSDVPASDDENLEAIRIAVRGVLARENNS